HRPVPTDRFEPFDFAPDDGRRARIAAGALVHAVDGVVVLVGVVIVAVAGSSSLWVAALLGAVIAAPLALGGGAAVSRLTLSALDEAPRLLSHVGVSLLVVAPVSFTTDSEAGVLLQAGLTATALVVGRGGSY